MRFGACIYDPLARAIMLRLEEQREKQVGQQERPNMVGRELQLDALGREPALRDVDAGVVEQNVES